MSKGFKGAPAKVSLLQVLLLRGLLIVSALAFTLAVAEYFHYKVPPTAPRLVVVKGQLISVSACSQDRSSQYYLVIDDGAGAKTQRFSCNASRLFYLQHLGASIELTTRPEHILFFIPYSAVFTVKVADKLYFTPLEGIAAFERHSLGRLGLIGICLAVLLQIFWVLKRTTR